MAKDQKGLQDQGSPKGQGERDDRSPKQQGGTSQSGTGKNEPARPAGGESGKDKMKEVKEPEREKKTPVAKESK